MNIKVMLSLSRMLRLWAQYGLGYPRIWLRRVLKKKKRVLMLKSRQDYLGDMVFVTGLLKHYRTIYPQAWIELGCPEASLALFQGCSSIDFVTPLPFFYRQNGRGRVASFLNSGRFDLVIALRRTSNMDYLALLESFRPATFVGCAGDTLCMEGDGDSRLRGLLRKPVVLDRNSSTLHELEVQLLLLNTQTDGRLTLEDIRPDIPVLPRQSDLVDQWMKQADPERPVILFSPCGSSPIRNWDVEKYSRLIQQLPPATLVFTGTRDHSVFYAKMNVYDLPQFKILNLVGQTSVQELQELIQRSDLVIAAENGVFHLAVAMGKKAICIAGGGHWKRFVPWPCPSSARVLTTKLDCFGCEWLCVREKIDCILDVPVERVLEEVQSCLP